MASKKDTIKLILTGDIHETNIPAESRLDAATYEETRRMKRKNIMALAVKHKVDAVVHPGDFFDSHSPDFDYAGKALKEWTESGIPLVGVVGNHDCWGNLNTWNKTIGKFISNVGLMNIVSKEKPYYIEKNGFKLAITGASHHLMIDELEGKPDYIVKEKLGDYHLHLVHGYLEVKKQPFICTMVDEIIHTQADFTLAGHDHLGFETVNIDGKYFANPGAIVRMSADVKEIDRKLKVILLEISTIDGSVKLKELEFGAEAGEKVLSRKKIEEKQKKEQKRSKVQSEIKAAALKKHTTLEDIVKEISKAKALGEDLTQRTLSDINNKRMEISSDKFKGAIIERVILENVYGHPYTDIIIDKHLNMIVGMSGKGKSAIIRALDWIYENEPSGKRIIKQGETFAKATIYLSNGYRISRYVEKKNGGKNGYFIYDPTTGEETFENTKSLQRVQEIIGHSILMIDNDYSIALNFSKQGEDWFLLGKSYTPSMKSKIIGSLYDVHFADAVIRDIDKNTKEIDKQLKVKDKEIEGLDKEISELNYIDELDNKVQTVKTMIEETEKMIEKKNQLLKLKEDYNRITDVLKQIEHILASTQNLENGFTELNNLKLLVFKRNQLDTVVNQYKNTTTALNKTLIAIKETENVEKSLEMIEVLKTLATQRVQKTELREKYVTLEQKQTNVKNEIKEINEVLVRTENVSKNLEKLVEIKTIVTKRDSLVETSEKISKIKKDIQTEEQNIEQSQKDLNKHLEEYKEVLEEAGQCPVCHGKIDKAVIKNIIKSYN